MAALVVGAPGNRRLRVVRACRPSAPRARSGAGRTAAGRTAASRCRRTRGPSARAAGPWRSRPSPAAWRTSRPSLAAYSGSRSGPRTTAASTTRRMNSQPLMFNTIVPVRRLAVSRSPCRVILTSDLPAAATHLQLTLSPTDLARIATTRSSGSVTRLPSNSTMTSPAFSPALPAGPSGVTGSRPSVAFSRILTPSPPAYCRSRIDADDRVLGLAGADQLLGGLAHLVARDGEADADVAGLGVRWCRGPARWRS